MDTDVQALLDELDQTHSQMAQASENTKAATKRQQDALQKVKEALARGESTGDPIYDFLLQVDVTARDTPGEKMLHDLQDRLPGKIGQFVMVVQRNQEPVIKCSHGHLPHGLDELMTTRTEYHIGVLMGDLLTLQPQHQQVIFPTGGAFVLVLESEFEGSLKKIDRDLSVQFTVRHLNGTSSVLQESKVDTVVYVGDEAVTKNLPTRRRLNMQDELRSRVHATLHRVAVMLGRPDNDPCGLAARDRQEVELIMHKQEAELERCLVGLLAVKGNRRVSADSARDAAQLLKQTWDYCLELGMEYPGKGHRFEWITSIEDVNFK